MAARGYLGRKPSDKQLARDIVASIREHAKFGVTRQVAEYTQREELTRLVNTILEAS
jgi:hypothetical protein